MEGLKKQRTKKEKHRGGKKKKKKMVRPTRKSAEEHTMTLLSVNFKNQKSKQMFMGLSCDFFESGSFGFLRESGE